jgi:uncharacterized repeat protein (TIGR03803 family)
MPAFNRRLANRRSISMISQPTFLRAFKAVVTLITLALATSAWADKLTVLHAFNGTEGGANPTTLVMDSSGNLYGVLTIGGLNNGTAGSIFKLTKGTGGTWTKSVIYRFTGGADGSQPTGIIMDASGNIFGIANLGGNVTACTAGGCGVVFKLTQTGGVWTESTIFSFSGPTGTGFSPTGNLVMDSAGNLYGGAALGGGSFGEVFELSPETDGTWSFSAIHRFATFAEGNVVIGPFVFDSAGNLYGATQAGGSTGDGTVFELSPASGGSWTFTKLHDFGGPPNDGNQPDGGLIIDGSGDLYGTTAFGGSHPGPGRICFQHCGTIFKLSQSSGSWTETVLVDFAGTNGSLPLGTLLMDAAGNLYGTAAAGGPNSWGTAFEASPTVGGQWNLSILYPFKNARDGGTPKANLVMDASGNLYGTGNTGGGPTGSGDTNTGNGVVFQLTPSAN